MEEERHDLPFTIVCLLRPFVKLCKERGLALGFVRSQRARPLYKCLHYRKHLGNTDMIVTLSERRAGKNSD